MPSPSPFLKLPIPIIEHVLKHFLLTCPIYSFLPRNFITDLNQNNKLFTTRHNLKKKKIPQHLPSSLVLKSYQPCLTFFKYNQTWMGSTSVSQSVFSSILELLVKRGIEPRMPTYVLLSIASRTIYGVPCIRSVACAVERRQRKLGHDFAGVTAVISRGVSRRSDSPWVYRTFEVSDWSSGATSSRISCLFSLSLYFSLFIPFSMYVYVYVSLYTETDESIFDGCLLLTGCNLSMELRVTILFFALVTRRRLL